MKILKIVFVLMIVLFGWGQSQAQTVEVKWGGSIRSPKNSYIGHIIGADSAGFYTLRVQQRGLFSLGRNTYFLERYSNKFSKNFSQELLMPGTDPNEVNLERLYYVNHELKMFTSYFNKRTLDYYAFASEINGKGIVHNELQEVDKIDARNRRRTGGFDFDISNDSTRFLVYHDEPYERRGKERFHVKIYDNDLYEQASMQVELPYDDVDAEIIDKIVDDSGKVYMLVRVLKEREERSLREQNYIFLVVLIDPVTGTVNEYDLSLQGRFITETGMRLDENGNMIAVGFYSERGEGRAKGIFYMKLDGGTKEVVESSTRELDSRFIADVSGRRNVRENRELSDFRLDHIEFLGDGSTVMVAEQYYVIVVTNTTPDGVMTTTYHYYHNDIIVANIGSDGEIKWLSRIPKKQHTVNEDVFSGYAFGHSDKSFFFIYNDHRRNVKQENERRLRYFTNPRTAMVMLATVNDKGEVVKTPLFSAKEQRTYTVPSVSYQVSDDEMLIYGIRGRNYKFGSVKMKD